MARDMSFWRYKKHLELKNSEVYYKLSNEEYIEEVDEIPVNLIKNKIDEVFKEWKTENSNRYIYKLEAFDLMLTKQFVRLDCYGISEEHINKVIDIMDSFNLCLYDSAIDIRFDGR